MVRTSSNLERRPDILALDTVTSDHAYARSGRPFAWAPRRCAPSPPRRIGLFGLFGSGNSGNDGSLEAMLVFLRQARPDAEITCICAARRGAVVQIARTLQVAAVPLGMPPPDNHLLQAIDRLLLGLPRRVLSLIHAIGRTRRLDALIVPGTGILDDFWEGPLNMPLTLFAWCLAARLCGTRIAFVSIGAGPIDHPISRWLMKSAVAMAQYRSYRDTISRDFMASIGFDTRGDSVYPDIAFNLPAPPPTRRHDTEHEPLTVGVGIMNYRGWRDDPMRGAMIYEAYLDKITAFVLWLLTRGHPVRILMGDQTDRGAMADLLARVASARPDLPQDRLRAEPTCSLHDLMRQIAQTDVMVATRYHNVVCALKLGKPTVSISYGQKNDVLMAEMGLAQFCQHIEHLNLDQLIRQLMELIADRRRYEQNIEQVNSTYQERLARQDLILASRFLGNTPSVQVDMQERHQ